MGQYIAIPRRLRECNDAPTQLCYEGCADLNAKRVLAIVGTRNVTTYGKDLIHNFMRELKDLCPDVLIVSGLAYGVDVAAHREALANGFQTVGVVAHGLDTIYPSAHRRIATEMMEQGGILTEYDVGTRINRVNFVQRNRIIAGMSDAVLLVESAVSGGGMITMGMANSYGRRAFAFPGAVGAKYSEGCNDLIRRGNAQLISCARDLVTEMNWMSASSKAKEAQELSLFADNLKPQQHKGGEQLRATNDQHIDQLAATLDMPVHDLQSELFMLEFDGVVSVLSGNHIHLNSSGANSVR